MLYVGSVQPLRQLHQERLVVVAVLVTPNHDPNLHDCGEVWLVVVALEEEDGVDGETDRNVVNQCQELNILEFFENRLLAADLAPATIARLKQKG